MHIYLVLLCLLSVVRVTGYSQFPCADRNGPSYCAHAICTKCVALHCRRNRHMDLFKSMCCASDVAQQLEECIILCENSSSTNLTRYDHDTKGPARLCPPNEIIGTCKQCLPCSEDMCIEDVQREVFGQQCIPKLNYDQLKSSECKDLAYTYNKSTPSMVTDDLRPSIPTKRSEMSSLPVVSSPKHVITEPADTVTTTEYHTTTPLYPRSTSSAHHSTIPAYQTTTPVHLTASEHCSDSRYVGFSSIIAVIAVLVATVGKDVLKLIDQKWTGSRCMNWYSSLFCKMAEKREVNEDESEGELLGNIQKEKDHQILSELRSFQEMILRLQNESRQMMETHFDKVQQHLRMQVPKLKNGVENRENKPFNHMQDEDVMIERQTHRIIKRDDKTKQAQGVIIPPSNKQEFVQSVLPNIHQPVDRNQQSVLPNIHQPVDRNQHTDDSDYKDSEAEMEYAELFFPKQTNEQSHTGGPFI